MAVRPSGYGPLPEIDRNDTLQRLSFQALMQAVPTDRFILRDESGSDKGVDWALEALLGGGASNLRSQIQVKGTDSDKFNSDGSFSLSVATSNLNYLLNGPSPLYVLWIAPRNELRFLFARDEARRLYDDNPNWQEQDSITLRFTRTLVPAEWNGIHETIVREGRLHRQTHDVLLQVATTEQITVAISSALSLTTPDEAYNKLQDDGIALACSGFAGEVLSLATLLTPQQLSSAKVQLSIGFCHFNTGDYHAARSHLGRATLTRDSLPDADRYILDSLLNTCDHYLGRNSPEQYRLRSVAIEQSAPQLLQLQLRLDRLRREHMRCRDESERRRLYAQFREAADAVIADLSSSVTLKLQVSLMRVYADAAHASSLFIRTAFLPLIRQALGLRLGQHSAALDGAIRVLNNLCDQASLLHTQARKLGNPAIIAEAIVVKVNPLVIQTANAILVGKANNRDIPLPSIDLQKTILDELEEGCLLFQKVGSIEGQMRVKHIMMHWLEINGRHIEAVEQAKQLLNYSLAMGNDRFTQDATDTITGKSQHQVLLDDVSTTKDRTPEFLAATDTDLREHAEEMVYFLDIPEHRVPIVERALRVLQRVSNEQENWCSHLQLLEDLRHMQSQDTRYATDPIWSGYCDYWKHHSPRRSTDSSGVIDWFKRVYCKVCDMRCPNLDQSATTAVIDLSKAKK